jgi:hypothetical protein
MERIILLEILLLGGVEVSKKILQSYSALIFELQAGLLYSSKEYLTCTKISFATSTNDALGPECGWCNRR